MAKAVFRKTIAIAALAMCATAPLHAQLYSEGYEFLKAVKDRDGTKVTDALNKPGSTLIDTRDLTTGRTALFIVTEKRDLVWMKFLLSKGADPNAQDKNGVTPLEIASSLGFVEGVEALLDRGARVDEPNSTGETPLISAIHARDVAMVRVLLAHGANPDRTDNSGRTARDYAALLGSGSRIADEIADADKKRAEGGTAKTYGPTG